MLPAPFTKSISIAILTVFIGIQLLLPLHAARAGAGFPTAEIYTPQSSILNKDWFLDTIARILVSTLIRSLTDSIVGWIQGNEGGNVGFVGNFEEAFLNELDVRGGEFLNKLLGVNLCGNIGAFLQVSLRFNSSLRYRFACSVTSIVENVEDFFLDFANGGWPAFIDISLRPQNNPHGAFLIGLDEALRTQNNVLRALEHRVNTGIGYEGGYITKDAGCETINGTIETLPPGIDSGDVVTNPDGSISLCYKQKRIKTPGALVKDMLDRSFGSGYDFAFVVDEINEAVVTIIMALITELISSPSEGIFNSSLVGLPATDDEYDGFLITTSLLPNGVEGVFYSSQLQVKNGVPPYTWSIKSGSLPPGLTLNPFDGVISGTPSDDGNYSFMVKVTDGIGLSTTKPFGITIFEGVEITSESPLPSGAVGVPYYYQFLASGGSGVYSWNIASGTPPTSLKLDVSGVLSGIPGEGEEGIYNFTVRVIDTQTTGTSTKAFILEIKEKPETPITIILPPPPPSP